MKKRTSPAIPRKKQSKDSRPTWTPFVLSRTKDPSDPEAEVFVNHRYQVSKRLLRSQDSSVPPLAHLSIRRLDRAAIHDWRDLQLIKNELVGPDCEGLELYPAEDRLVDTANSYHLWVFSDTTFRMAIGFQQRLIAEGPFSNGAVQRPWKPSQRPADCLDGKAFEQKYPLKS